MKVYGTASKIVSIAEGGPFSGISDEIVVFRAEEAPPGSGDEQKRIALTEQMTPVQVMDYLLSSGIAQVVPITDSVDYDLLLAARMAEAPSLFVEDARRCLLKNDDLSPVLRISFDSSRQKNEIISKFSDWAKNITNHAILLERADLIVDEFFTNAVFDAPSAQPVSRDQSVHFLDGKKAEMFAFTDEHTMFVGCTDPYGTLNVRRMIERLRRVYEGGIRESMNFGPGGAGIGMRMVLDACSSFYAGVVPGRKTTLVCSLRLHGCSAQNNKGFHYVEVTP